MNAPNTTRNAFAHGSGIPQSQFDEASINPLLQAELSSCVANSLIQPISMPACPNPTSQLAPGLFPTPLEAQKPPHKPGWVSDMSFNGHETLPSLENWDGINLMAGSSFPDAEWSLNMPPVPLQSSTQSQIMGTDQTRNFYSNLNTRVDPFVSGVDWERINPLANATPLPTFSIFDDIDLTPSDIFSNALGTCILPSELPRSRMDSNMLGTMPAPIELLPTNIVSNTLGSAPSPGDPLLNSIGSTLSMFPTSSALHFAAETRSNISQDHIDWGDESLFGPTKDLSGVPRFDGAPGTGSIALDTAMPEIQFLPDLFCTVNSLGDSSWNLPLDSGGLQTAMSHHMLESPPPGPIVAGAAVVFTQSNPAIPGPKASKAPKTEDWDGVKLIIGSVYLFSNLALQEVVEYMAKSHNFHATRDMYKKRFRKWGWTKYSLSSQGHGDERPTQQRKRKAETCYRNPILRRSALNQAFTAEGLLESVLRDWKTCLEVDLAEPSTWRMTSRFDHHLRLPGCKPFEKGIRRLGIGQRKMGKKLVLRGLQCFWSSLVNMGMREGCNLLLRFIARILQWRQWQLLAQFLLFLKKLSLKMQQAHNLSQIASTLIEILGLSPGHIIQFIDGGYQVLVDFISNILGPTGAHGTLTATSLYIRKHQLLCQKRLKTSSAADRRWAVEQLVREYGDLIGQAEREAGPRDAINLRYISVSFLWSISHWRYSGDFFDRCQAAIHHISTAIGPSMSVSDWVTTGDLTRFFLILRRLRGDRARRGKAYYELIYEAIGGLLELISLDDEVSRLCELLRIKGLGDLADMMDETRTWQTSRNYLEEARFESLAEVEDSFEGLPIFDGTTSPDDSNDADNTGRKRPRVGA